MKSYTDINQSKKLAKILPIESADMWHHGFFTPSRMCKIEYNPPAPYHSVTPQLDCPCWSLVALFGVLPANYIDVNDTVYHPNLMKTKDGRCMVIYNVSQYTSLCNNPIDACYEMILKLHDLNLL